VIDDEPAVGRVEPQVRWRGVLREFVTIVAGVLVALGGQAWWGRQQDRERERSYLHQLLVDTRVNEREFRDAIALDRSVNGALRALGTTLYASGPLPAGDSLLSLFRGQIFSSSNLQTRSGTVTALLSSGDLRLVHTDSLRAEIVAYAAGLASDEEMFRLYFAQAFSDPGRIGRVLPFTRRLFLALPPAEEHRFRERDARELVALRNDPELAGILFALEAANNNRLVHLRMQEERTIRLRKMLEAEGIK
jgi:hypothetical protein